MDTKAQSKTGIIAEIKEELKKVEWPTKEETIKLTSIVIVISLLIGSYIGIIDFLLAKALAILTQ